MVMTKFEKVQQYFSRHGARLEKRKDRYGKEWYHLIATKKHGHIKPGEEMMGKAATLGTFERLANRKILGNEKVGKEDTKKNKLAKKTKGKGKKETKKGKVVIRTVEDKTRSRSSSKTSKMPSLSRSRSGTIETRGGRGHIRL